MILARSRAIRVPRLATSRRNNDVTDDLIARTIEIHARHARYAGREVCRPSRAYSPSQFQRVLRVRTMRKGKRPSRHAPRNHTVCRDRNAILSRFSKLFNASSVHCRRCTCIARLHSRERTHRSMNEPRSSRGSTLNDTRATNESFLKGAAHGLEFEKNQCFLCSF